jgi:gas vesicle protein
MQSVSRHEYYYWLTTTVVLLVLALACLSLAFLALQSWRRNTFPSTVVQPLLEISGQILPVERQAGLPSADLESLRAELEAARLCLKEMGSHAVANTKRIAGLEEDRERARELPAITITDDEKARRDGISNGQIEKVKLDLVLQVQDLSKQLCQTVSSQRTELLSVLQSLQRSGFVAQEDFARRLLEEGKQVHEVSVTRIEEHLHKLMELVGSLGKLFQANRQDSFASNVVEQGKQLQELFVTRFEKELQKMTEVVDTLGKDLQASRKDLKDIARAVKNQQQQQVPSMASSSQAQETLPREVSGNSPPRPSVTPVVPGVPASVSPSRRLPMAPPLSPGPAVRERTASVSPAPGSAYRNVTRAGSTPSSPGWPSMYRNVAVSSAGVPAQQPVSPGASMFLSSVQYGSRR